MGKLTDKLEHAARGGAQPMGFAAARVEKTPSMLLLAKVSANGAGPKAVADAGLDGALVVPGSKKDMQSAAKALSGVPWGPWVDVAQTELPDGADFQVFASDATPVAAIGGEGQTIVMQASPDMDDETLRAIDDLPVDAFFVSLVGEEPLTVRSLLRLARVGGVTSKWLLLHVSKAPTKHEAEQLRDAGVSALVLDADGIDAERLREARQTLLDLSSAAKRSKERRTATLPSIGLPGGGSRRRPEPDEDDYDDDE